MELYLGHGIDTIDKIFGVYFDDNKPEYKAVVSKALGTALHDKFDSGNKEQVTRLMRGIITMENAPHGKLISDEEARPAGDASHLAVTAIRRGANSDYFANNTSAQAVTKVDVNVSINSDTAKANIAINNKAIK